MRFVAAAFSIMLLTTTTTMFAMYECLVVAVAADPVVLDNLARRSPFADANDAAAPTTTISDGGAGAASNECEVYREKAPTVFILLDRICELCQLVHSDKTPNIGFECRTNCFRSAGFKRCLRLFKRG